jgi:hypothetical protein
MRFMNERVLRKQTGLDTILYSDRKPGQSAMAPRMNPIGRNSILPPWPASGIGLSADVIQTPDSGLRRIQLI